jgi:hypothetical protein
MLHIKNILKIIRWKWHNDLNLDGVCYETSRAVCQTANELSILCDLYGSDKGSVYGGGAYYKWLAHTYTPVYEYLFKPIREDVKLVFECGLGTNNPKLASSMGDEGNPGASLKVWRDYFPNAMIVGGDIDKDILFEDERIYTGYIDQLSNDEIVKFFTAVQARYNKKFDIMVDDGLHTFEAGVCLFDGAFQYLKDNGYYIIEDVDIESVKKFKEYFREYPQKNMMQVRYMLMPIKNNMANNMIIIQRKESMGGGGDERPCFTMIFFYSRGEARNLCGENAA